MLYREEGPRPFSLAPGTDMPRELWLWVAFACLFVIVLSAQDDEDAG